MADALEDKIIAELQNGNQLSKELVSELRKILDSRRQERKEKRLSLVRSRLSQSKNQGLFRSRLGGSPPPSPSGRFPHIVPGIPFLPFYETIVSQTSDYLLGVPEQPVFGALTPITLMDEGEIVGEGIPIHSYSELTRKSTGEVSVAASVTDSSENQPHPGGIIEASASIVQMWVLPELPKMGFSVLGAYANVSGSNLTPSFSTDGMSSAIAAATPNSAAATYGFASITFSDSLFPANPNSTTVEFLRNETWNPNSQYSDFDSFGNVTLNTNLKYSGNSVFLFAEVEISVVCAVVEDAPFAGAIADLRFADDNSLAVYLDFPIAIDDQEFSPPLVYQPFVVPPTSSIRVTVIQVDGR